MKKITKFIKILMVFVIMFYQLSPAATVLAAGLTEPDNEEINETVPENNDSEEQLDDSESDEEELDDDEEKSDDEGTKEEKENDDITDPNEDENENSIFGDDDDAVLNEMYDGEFHFENGYVFVNAKGYLGSDSIPTVGDFKEGKDEKVSLTVTSDGTKLDTDDDSVLSKEIKNNDEIEFTDNTDVSVKYTVIVVGDVNDDNELTKEDIEILLDDYLNEKNVPSMDVTSEEDDEVFGTVTFKDVAIINGALTSNTDDSDNKDLNLSLESDTEQLYVGDTVNVDLIVNSSETLDYIDGIEGIISTTNLELTDIMFNDDLTGVYTDDGKFAAVGKQLDNGKVVITLVLTATQDGQGKVEISDGRIAKYTNISDFDNLLEEFEIIRRASSNANLASLNASVGDFDLAFDRDITEYTLTVPYDTESVILSGSLEDDNANVQGLIEYVLNDETTVATIVVTGEDGTTKTYTVTIVKESEPVLENNADDTNISVPVNYKRTYPVVYYYSSDSYLKSLEIDGFDINFDKDTYEYKITVPSNVTSLDIKALANNLGARVEITGNENFKTGENIVLITVTAEDGSTSIYKLIVNKESPAKPVVKDGESSNKVEKIIIIILIVLVVLGLLYLIFKKDEDEDDFQINKNKNEKNSNINSGNNFNKNDNKQKNKKKE